jgi:hypothetical protein
MVSSEYGEWIIQLLASMQNDYYVIRSTRNLTKYYYFDFDQVGESNYKLIWTPSYRSAFLFDSEEMVEEFKSKYISPRKAAIVRLPKGVIIEQHLDLVI